MNASLRRLTAFGIFAGVLLALLVGLVSATPRAYADDGGGTYGGAGSGGSGSGTGCNRYHSSWAYSPNIPSPDGGCTSNPSKSSLDSSCHAGSNVGNWVWYLEQTDGHGGYHNSKGSNPGDPKNSSTPASAGGLMLSTPNTGYQENDIRKILRAEEASAKSGHEPIRNGFANKSWDSPSNEVLIIGAALKRADQYSGSGGIYKKDGRYFNVVCVWLNYNGKSCSGLCTLKPPVQYCSGYGVNSRNYVIRRGVNTATTKASSASDALTKCALHCPTSSSSDPNHVRAYIQHSGAAIRASYNTGAKMGAYCYHRAGTRNTETQNRLLTTSGKRTVSPEYIYGYNIDLLPDDEDFGQRTHPGPDKLVYQTTETVMPLGQFVNSYNYKNNTCPTVAQLNAAAAKNVGVSHGNVALNAENKRGLAEGGILTVRENIERIQLLLTPTTKQAQVRTRVRTQMYSFTLYNTGAEFGVGDETGYHFTYTAWTAWKNSGSPVHSCGTGENTETGENGGLYQIFTNHCDASAAQSKAASTGATVVANGDSTQNFSGSVISRTDNLNEFEPQWGWGEGDRAGQWNKLCAYQGQKASTGSPASVTYFRDNAPHATSVDLYRPQSSGVVTYNGQQASATMVSLWSGSLQAPGVSNMGQFQMMANGQPLFSNDASPAPVLTQWGSVNAIQEKYFGLMPGQVTSFGMEADWPTDQGKPEVFTTKWIYTPSVSNVFPVVVGFDSHDQRTDTLGTVSTPIEGEVYSMQGTAAASPALTTLVKNATGDIERKGQAPVVNTLDGRLAFGTKLDSSGAWIPEPVAYSPYYREVHFVRAVTN